MTGLLASVRDMGEALVAAAAPVDILDLKAPDRGALGALEVDAVAAIVRRLRGSRAISATIGDQPLDPSRVVAAVRAMAATGVDYVKIGLFPGGDLPGTLAALEPLARSGIRLVAVLFADHDPSPAPAQRLAAAGFTGCMLDTADKTRGSLTEWCTPEQLQRFITEVRRNGLLCGLAGSLAASDIPGLLSLQPDYLGFRGALCRDHRRTLSLDRDLLEQIAMAVRAGPTHRTAPSLTGISASPTITLEATSP